MTYFWKVGVVLAASLCLVSCASATDTSESSSSPADALFIDSDGNVSNLDEAEPTTTSVPTETIAPAPEPPVAESTPEPAPADTLDPPTNSVINLPGNPAGCDAVMVDGASPGLPIRFTDGTPYEGDPTLASQLGLDGLYSVYENCTSNDSVVAMGTIGTYCTVTLVDFGSGAPSQFAASVYRTDEFQYGNIEPQSNDRLRVIFDAYDSVCNTPGAGLSL